MLLSLLEASLIWTFVSETNLAVSTNPITSPYGPPHCPRMATRHSLLKQSGCPAVLEIWRLSGKILQLPGKRN